MSDLFANPEALGQSWYVAARSRAVRAGRTYGVELGPRRIVVYRDEQGQAHAIDARCPHLGADLTQGTVCASGLRCAFHGWTFGADGSCTQAPGYAEPPPRRARSYPVLERWGFIWVFNGPVPRFDLPSVDDVREWRTVALPAQTIRCHPHLVLANGLDLSHYETLHGLRFTAPARLLTDSPHAVTVEMRGRAQRTFWRAVSGTWRTDLIARFTTYGGSLAWSTVIAPIRFHVLFTGRPDRQGRCVTQTIFFLPRVPGPGWARALALMTMLLHDDRRVLDTIDFRPAFADGDEPLKAFASVVNMLGSW